MLTLYKIKKNIKLLIQAIKIVREDFYNQDKSSKSLLVIGNGYESIHLDYNKINKLVREEKLDVAVCNGYFNHGMNNLSDLPGIYMFYLDDMMNEYYRIREENSETASKSALLLKYNNTSLEFIVRTYVLPSIEADYLSLKIASQRKNTNLVLHPSLNCLINNNKNNSICLIHGLSFNITLYRILKFTKIAVERFYTTLGAGVISSAVSFGLCNKYKNIYVIGHSDGFFSEKFKIKSDFDWKINYRNFWDETDRFVDRTDSLSVFSRVFMRQLSNEFRLATRVKDKIVFLSPYTTHLAFVPKGVSLDVLK
jgi:hypothetical protein